MENFFSFMKNIIEKFPIQNPIIIAILIIILIIGGFFLYRYKTNKNKYEDCIEEKSNNDENRQITNKNKGKKICNI